MTVCGTEGRQVLAAVRADRAAAATEETAAAASRAKLEEAAATAGEAAAQASGEFVRCQCPPRISIS